MCDSYPGTHRFLNGILCQERKLSLSGSDSLVRPKQTLASYPILSAASDCLSVEIGQDQFVHATVSTEKLLKYSTSSLKLRLTARIKVIGEKS